MKNNNLGAEWINVAKYKNDGTITPSTYNETTIAIDGNGVKITPTGLSDNTVHNGLLKVLRDYKHYAQVLVTRENSNGQVITASFADDEENMYTARQITDRERAKICMLTLSDGFYRMNNGGKLDLGSEKDIREGTGDPYYTGYYYLQHTGQVTKDFKYKLTDYSPKFPTRAGGDANKNNTITAQVLQITVDSVVYRHSTTAGSYPKKFAPATIKVTPTDKFLEKYNSYTVDVTFDLSMEIDFWGNNDGLSGSIKSGSLEISINEK